MAMTEIENNLIYAFHVGFWLYFSAALIFMILAVVLILFKRALLADFKKMRLVYPMAAVIVFAGLIFFIYRFTMFYMDLDDVNLRRFETVTGKVVGYARVSASDFREPVYEYPIFEIVGTGERIRILTGPAELHKTYTVMYLRHSKIGEIVAFEQP